MTTTNWEVPKELQAPDHKTCPYTVGEIQLSHKAHSKITALMDHFTVEWLGYLIGEWRGDAVFIKDLMIPDQKTSAASVSQVDEAPPRGAIGVIHSHVAMGAFFSGTDDAWINSNHNVSVVVSRKGGAPLEFKSQVRKTVACGANMIMELPVKLVEVSQKGWLDTVVDKVKNMVHVTPTYLKPQKYTAHPQGAITRKRFNKDTTSERQAMFNSYALCVKAITDAQPTAEGILAVLAPVGDADLEAAVDYIDRNNGNHLLADLFDDELDRRAQAAAKSVGRALVEDDPGDDYRLLFGMD